MFAKRRERTGYEEEEAGALIKVLREDV